MSDAFDPYHHWLGIPPAEQPPNHYRLLGVALFEPDPEVIDNAAKQQIRRVQGLQSAAHIDEALQLLNEISFARVCLLCAERRCEYDLKLRSEMAAPTVVSTSFGCPAEFRIVPTQSRRRRRNGITAALIFWGLVVAVAVLCFVLGVMSRSLRP